MPVILARDVHKGYTGFAPVLRGVDMEAGAGEMVAVMGPSGCGKSTMLHVLGMLHPPDSGRLDILGTDVSTLNREQAAAFRRVNVGFVMQSSNLFDHATVFENVEFPLIYEGIPPQERWERVIRALDLVRLSARVHYRSNRLSGGEQQRAAIARAMVNNPRILLADEPTGALDARTSRHIMENFRTLCHEGGVCLIIVTHDPKMAEYCDTVYALEDGLLHCRKRDFTPVSSVPSPGLPRLAHGGRGVFVVERFTGDPGSPSAKTARLLHARGLLARVYALRDSGFSGLSEDYALPLAVRVAGLSRFAAVFPALRRNNEAGYRAVRKSLSAAFRGKSLFTRLLALGCGALLARWAAEDGAEFFIGAPGYFSAAAARAAAGLAGVPFALFVRGVDAADGRVLAFAGEARCLCCEDESRDVWLKRLADMPGMSEDRLLALSGPLPGGREEADGDSADRGEPDDAAGDPGGVSLTSGQRKALARLKTLLSGERDL
ncbi:MAG: ABC transporter ATP-binding protein [Desulfovibrio sp.]|jgi:ABC-type lipoprotein export system ATPase subunit|nr:ABC transporter ATP-binding protein [Desulfovibrio sp.]